MNLISDFEASLTGSYAASTQRVYICAAKKAATLAGANLESCDSYEGLLTLLRQNLADNRFPNALRIAPFLRFLQIKMGDSSEPKGENSEKLKPVRIWILDRIDEETKIGKPSIFVRRDLAMLAGVCFAPDKGSPRLWPKTALVLVPETSAIRIQLWGKMVDTPELAMPLLYWYSWRERLDRPVQSRIYRKAWAFSDLLFPNSKGDPLKKQALHNALARLRVSGEGRVRLTPQDVRTAFLGVTV